MWRGYTVDEMEMMMKFLRELNGTEKSDRADAEIMSVIEENNDKMTGKYAHSAQQRRAFIGVQE